MSKAKVLLFTDEPTSRLAGSTARVSKSGDAKGETRRGGAKAREVSRDASAEGSCSSDSSCGIASVRTGRERRGRRKVGKGVWDGSELSPTSPLTLEKRRCAWITPNSDPLYVSFHDEEWGRPVHDDRKLFELLSLSSALAELCWPTILSNRDIFRERFENFDPTAVAKFSEKKTISLNSSGNRLLSELKLRAIVGNARQALKVIEEFGSLDQYFWRFVNHKPIAGGHCYPRQVPTKTPKAEVISKDLIKRGFQCVGPTAVYSFMQAAGLINDHLRFCFRYKECIDCNIKDGKDEAEKSTSLANIMNNACTLQK